jgi:hypothetical protein
MDNQKIVKTTKLVLGALFVLAGAWLLISPASAANFFCQHKPILAILMIISGGFLAYKKWE